MLIRQVSLGMWVSVLRLESCFDIENTPDGCRSNLAVGTSALFRESLYTLRTAAVSNILNYKRQALRFTVRYQGDGIAGWKH
jgi:hypothetical protein